MESPPGTSASRRTALIGLLGIALLAGFAVIGAAALTYRAVGKAAWAVRRQRAAEVANAFASTVKAARILNDQTRLQDAVRESNDGQFRLDVLTLDGNVVAAASRDGKAQVELSLSVLNELRLQGHVFHRRGDGLTYFRFLRRGPPPAGGWRFRRRRWGAGPRPGHMMHRGFRHRMRVLRVNVGSQVGAKLLAVGRGNLIASGAVAFVLWGLAFMMFRLARKASLAERDAAKQRSLAQLGEMAAVLAHEIRTPLGSIKGNAQLLTEERMDTRAESIVGEAARLERLVNGMLDYARPAPPQRVAVDANALMRKAAEIVAPIALERKVGLLTEPGERLARLNADGDQILQVLVNLIQNAVEATAAAEGNAPSPVVVGVGSRSGCTVFRIQDRGVGLGDAKPEQLFKPFHSQKRKGAGLGLSVSRRIVELHGGTLELLQRDGGGVAVNVWLPNNGSGVSS